MGLQNFIEKIISRFKKSDSPIKIIKINKEITFKVGEKFISIKPSTLSLDIDFELKYQIKLLVIREINLKFMKMICLMFIIQEHFVCMKI